MAQLRRMSPESFSSARDRLSATTIGLGSILRDHKIMSGMSQANVLLGLSTQSSSRSVSKPPAIPMPSSHLLDGGGNQLDATVMEDFDELKEEDVWPAENMSWHDAGNSLLERFEGNPSQGNSLLERFEGNPSQGNVGDSEHDDAMAVHGNGHSGHPHKVSSLGLVHGHALVNVNIGTQGMSAVVKGIRAPLSRSEKGFGLADALVNKAATGFTSLSRVPDGASNQLFQLPSHAPTSSWMIPQSGAPKARHGHPQSAPVNVQDWSKIVKADSKVKSNGIIESDEDDDEEEERLPPHELVAREYAKSQRTTFSVCEGQGRTLKGRDLSRVRNAVWSKIGFAD